VPGAFVSTPRPGDSTAFPPKPKLPSARAQFILTYNKYPGKCPQRADTLTSTDDIAFALLVDSIPDRPRADQLSIGYDVCGLPQNSAFNATFVLTKAANKIGWGGKELREPPTAEIAKSPRQRMRHVMNTKEMSPGDYHLDVTVRYKNKTPITISRPFKIIDK
jgi:hypothetical protein